MKNYLLLSFALLISCVDQDHKIMNTHTNDFPKPFANEFVKQMLLKDSNEKIKSLDIQGRWNSNKVKISRDYWISSVLEIKSNTVSLVQKHYLSCQVMELCTPTKIYEYNFSKMELISSANENHRIQLQVKDILLTVYDQLEADINNEDHYFGQSNWQIGVPVNITGKKSVYYDDSNMPKNGDVAKVIFKKENDTIKIFGLFTQPNIGEFPTDLELESLYSEKYTNINS